jgi:hypothetical protein
MKRQGRLVRWEAERGFRFIRSPDVSADVFVRLRDLLCHKSSKQSFLVAYRATVAVHRAAVLVSVAWLQGISRAI